MGRVTGIGGFFFRAKNPGILSDWYEKHLGISRVPKTYEEGSWWQDEGPTVLAPFDDQNEFLAKFGSQWIINFRVDDLDAVTTRLTKAGIEVDTDPENYPNGRFAYLSDPEGNQIQLWEAAGTDSERAV